MKKSLNIYIIPILLLLIGATMESTAQQQALTIDEAVALGVQRNRLLNIAELEKAKSAEQLKEARGSLLPTVSISGSYLHYFQKQVSFLPGSFVGLGENQIAPIRVGGTQSFVSSLNLSQPIFNPVANSGIRSSKISERVTTQDWLATRNNIVTEIKKAYLDVLIIEEQEKLQKQSIIRNELALKDARSLMAQGRASRADTLRAYVSLQNLKPELRRLEQQVLVNQILLKKILGLNDQETITLRDSLSLKNFSATSANFQASEALQGRPEVLGASLNERLQAAQIKKEFSNRMPQLSLIGALLGQTQANNLEISNYNFPMTSYLGLQLYVPVFSGFRNLYRSRQAKIAHQQSEKQLEDVKAQVSTEASVSMANLEEARARILSQQEVVNSAELGFQLTRDRYKQGISSRLELADAELSLTTAKSNYLQAVYDYTIAGITLERALGIVLK